MQRWLVVGLLLVGGWALLAGCGGEEDERIQPQILISATPRPTITPTIPTPEPTPSGTLTPTPCVGNTEWEDTYEVLPNDTLGGIALLSGTTVVALREGNCLTDSDFVFVGQVLRVPNTFSLTLATNPEGVNGIIIFVNRADGGLWAVRSNGSFPRALTEGLLVWGQPVRSPDLTQVAFRAVSRFHLPEADTPIPEHVPTDIYVINIDGSGLRQVVDQGPQDNVLRSDPVWSPPGEQLAFAEQRGIGGSVVVIKTDGQNRQVVLTGQVAPGAGFTPPSPVWSPVEDQLAVVTWDERGGSQLVLTGVTVRSGVQQVLLENFIFLGGPYWVPFNGANGRPAVAVNDFDAFRGEVWRVVDPETGTTERRNSGVRLTDATLQWWLASHNNSLLLYDNGVPDGALLEAALAFGDVSFAPNIPAVVVATDAGLQYFGLDQPVRTRIFNGDVAAPAWSEPLWLALP
jgi:hypothetical protein